MLANKARTVTRRDGEIVMGRLIAAPFPFGHVLGELFHISAASECDGSLTFHGSWR